MDDGEKIKAIADSMGQYIMQNYVEPRLRNTVQFFRAVVTSGESGALTYQWEYRPDENTAWADVSDASGATPYLTVTAALADSGTQYRCKISDGVDTVYSNIVTLTVEATPAFAITGQPQSVTVGRNFVVKYEVTAAGAASYQWQQNTGSGTWSNTTESGADTAVLTVNASQSKNGYSYRCIVDDGNGNTLTSNPAGLSVSVATPFAITGQPQSVTVADGETALFIVTATGRKNVMGVRRPFDTASLNLPYVSTAANLPAGSQCIVLVFGDMSNAIVFSDGRCQMEIPYSMTFDQGTDTLNIFM